MQVFSYKKGSLFAEQVDLPGLVRSFSSVFPTPFYVYSSLAIKNNYGALARIFASPRFRLHYALKANSNLSLLSLLREQGASVEIVSGGELKRALAAGFSPAQIIFTGVGKTDQEMELALAGGIGGFTVESPEELALLSIKAQEKGVRAPVLLRFNPEISVTAVGTHPKITTGHEASKFGLSFKDIVQLASSWDFSLDLEGIAVHIGSQIGSLMPYEEAYERLKELLGQVQAQGHRLSKLDLGGGYGVEMTQALPEGGLSFDFQGLYHLIQKYFSDFEGEIILEPGRSLVANGGILISQVLYRKSVNGQNLLVIDAGMNDFMRPALYDAFHPLVPLVLSEALIEEVGVVGPICESSDCFARQIQLPSLKRGDLVGITYTGAYGSSLSNTYNSRSLVGEILVQDEEVKIIRSPIKIEEQMLWERKPSS